MSEEYLEIVDIEGRTIWTGGSESATPGVTREFSWDGRDRSGRSQPSGIYLLKATCNGRSQTRLLHLIR